MSSVFGSELVRFLHHSGPDQLGVIKCRVQGIRAAKAPVGKIRQDGMNQDKLK